MAALRRSPLAVLALIGIAPASGCSIEINGEEEQRKVAEGPSKVIERTTIKKAPRSIQRAPEQPDPGGTLTQAAATVEREGYEVVDFDSYDASSSLRVLIGVRKQSATSTAQKAFFFLGGDYLGTDTLSESAGIKYAGQEDTTVSLTYSLYRPDDPNCCPTGGEKTVRFHWSGKRLVPLDQIPSDSLGAPLSRR